MIEAILRADPEALRRLAASHRESWQCLAPHMASGGACPPGLVHAMLAIDDPRGWEQRLFSAFMGLNPDEGMAAHYDFRRWFGAGIISASSPSDIVSLRVRLTALLAEVDAGAARRTAVLVADLRAAGDAEAYRELEGRALLLLARRLGEADDHEGAIAAAGRAQALFTALGDATWSAQAVRMHGAALLRMRRIDDALAVLDSVAHAPSAGFASEGALRGVGAIQNPDGTYRAEKQLDATDAALEHAAAIAVWATADDPNWIAALARIADVTGHPECAARSPRADTTR